MKIDIIGAGKWGSALFHALSQRNDCVITSRRQLEGSHFVSLDEALKSDLLVVAIPSQSVSGWLKEHFKDFGQKILVASKGIETSSLRFLDEIYERHVDAANLAFLSGPSFAKEIQNDLPCALVINSKNEALAREVSGLFPQNIKAYASSDVIGAEIAGAYKNVIAIAGGICDGLGLGNSARASLISRGLVDLASISARSSRPFWGLAGRAISFSRLHRCFRATTAWAWDLLKTRA